MHAETVTQHRRVDLAGAVDNVDTSTLGGRIAFSRMRKNLTQAGLASIVKNKKDGQPKSRASIVQYEANKILPPLDVIEVIAQQLNVSPSYLAFGEHVVEGITHTDVEMIAFPEITFGKDGEYVSSSMAYSKERFAQLGIDKEHAKAYILPQDARAFGLNKADVIIVDTSVTEPSAEGGLYLIRTQSGADVIRFDKHYGSGPRPKQVTFHDANDRQINAKVSDLSFIGAIVSTVRSGRP